jgi:hypothetical protein
MQNVEEFMRQYFDERAVDERREQASRVPFRRKFHTDDCRWDRRAGTLEMMETEKIVSVSSLDAKAEVITTQHILGRADTIHQLRYHLKPSGDGWRIRDVDTWCAFCNGEAGNSSCTFCQGTGWHVRKHRI